MSTVKFAHICDHCQKRSEEYGCFDLCRDCMTHVCPDCTWPGSSNGEGKCLCEECGKQAMANELYDPPPFPEDDNA